ncbi:hypothetical protein BLNAU_23877 [Blattamonas nauphoetae]|uniref:Uncharacterized protein n=1 Tax=Blattamonas nauphoetae TaxID=2049346 RepID=A0ABQ9WNX7_9EUKA|nr:hypothetical protein BLNAU_23877 [Blattamonas nauphoetae]
MVCSDQTISQRNINTVIFVPRLRITELLLTSNKYKKTANPIKLCLSPLDFAQAKFPLIVPLASRTTKLKIGVIEALSFSTQHSSVCQHRLPSFSSICLSSLDAGRLHKHDAKVVSLNSRVLGVRTPSDPSTPVPPNHKVEIDSSLSASHTLVTELWTPHIFSLHLAIPITLERDGQPTIASRQHIANI